MPKQSKKQKESNYVTTIRHPLHKAIAAGIFRGRTPDGFTYLYFELSRSWMAQSSGKKGYSSKLYERHDQAVADVALASGAWIRANQELADGLGEDRHVPVEIVAQDVAEPTNGLDDVA